MELGISYEVFHRDGRLLPHESFNVVHTEGNLGTTYPKIIPDRRSRSTSLISNLTSSECTTSVKKLPRVFGGTRDIQKTENSLNSSDFSRERSLSNCTEQSKDSSTSDRDNFTATLNTDKTIGLDDITYEERRGCLNDSAVVSGEYKGKNRSTPRRKIFNLVQETTSILIEPLFTCGKQDIYEKKQVKAKVIETWSSLRSNTVNGRSNVVPGTRRGNSRDDKHMSNQGTLNDGKTRRRNEHSLSREKRRLTSANLVKNIEYRRAVDCRDTDYENYNRFVVMQWLRNLDY